MKFIYTGIEVTDLEKSLRFYTGVLKMQSIGRYKIPETGGEVVHLKSKGSEQTLELNWYPPESKFRSKRYIPGDGLDHLAFQVEDARKKFDKFEKKKIPIALKPFKEGEWWLFYVKDPDGNWIEVGSRIKSNKKKKSH